MKRLAAVLTTGGIILLAGCGGHDDTRADAGSQPAAPAAAALAVPRGAATSMRVVLTGGPKPGTYEKTSEDPTCTVGYASEGAWGNAASDLEDNSGLIGIDLIVPKPEAAKAGTSEFMMAVYLDDRLDPDNQFVIDPKNGKGTGMVIIDDRGGSGTVKARGRTPEGVDVDARIECRQILRAW